MLVLSRKAGEQIVVAGKIIITVCQIDPKKVRIGIEAPKSVEIVRSELLTLPTWCQAPKNTCMGINKSRLPQQIEHCKSCPYCNVEILN